MLYIQGLIVKLVNYEISQTEVSKRKKKTQTYCANKFNKNCGVVGSGLKGGLKTWPAEC